VNFYSVVDQAIALLRQRGRVTYRALKRQFDLDDDVLADLTEELIYGQRLAADEDGRVLVWTGDMPRVPEPHSSLSPSGQQSTTHADQPSQAEMPPVSQRSDAERRQLTVLFCDLADSTRLASQLDPEDLREVIRAYQATCAEVIQGFEGYIAQYLGDGLLVYFGYPQAHEDDAQRAVRTGLDVIEAIGPLNSRLEQDKGIRLSIRLGIHTGVVVVGAMGGEGRQEQLALGEVPNIASRIQGLAELNTVLISADTYRLIQGYFDCRELGEHALRGVAQPIAVYRVLQESGAQSRLEVASTRGLTPLVGRESEVTLLLERWNQVQEGQGQVVLLTGEGGIGKSRLVQVLKDHVASAPHIRWECRSSPYYQNTALYPITDLMHRILPWSQDETSDERLAKLAQHLRQFRLSLGESVPLFAPLLSLSLPENRYPPLTLSPQRQRQKTLESLVAMLLELAERQPVLFILEDVHWTDPTTLEFLGLLVEHVPAAAINALLTCRPHFQPAWHHRSYLTEITVNRLSRHQIAHMATHVAGGKTLPAEIIQQLVDKTDGVPLYIEEMTKAILESGHLKATNGRYELTGTLPALAIPATLQDSLMARLDRLVTAKGLAQQASVIGRQFSYALLQAVSQRDAATLQQELGRLVDAEIVYQRGVPPQATYVFKHALIQDAAYASLLKSTRQQYHQRIAQVLEVQFPETTEAQPELLARHYTEAGLTEKAVPYWHHAGQRASVRSAHVEAIAHLRQGLALLQTLPETPDRVQQEVDMHIALGASLLATKGYAVPEVEQTYIRAQLLCEHLADPYQLFPVLRGLWSYYNVRAEYQTAYALGEQLLALAQQVQDSAMLLAAHRALGTTLFFLGVASAAHIHFMQGVALYEPEQHHSSAFLYGDDAGVVCHSHAARTMWLLGYSDQGLARNDEAITLAQQTAHPFSLGYALSSAAIFHQCRREGRAVQERAEAATLLAKEQGFPYWLAVGSLLRGWALAHQGQVKEGIKQIIQGLSAYRATGAVVNQPYFLALFVEAHEIMGQPEAGLTVLTEALTLVDSTSEHFYEAELHRLKGELLLQQNSANHIEAEACFHHAIDIARHQLAKSLELRAATSLARLWQQQDKRAEAHALLAEVYGWFTEGFDTTDLQQAKALLEELEG
jgi:class 3 adenylate cyclase/predicted ATPase